MARFISLRELKESKLEALQDMQLLKRPQLSVQRVSPAEWNCILELEKEPSSAKNKEISSKGRGSPTSTKDIQIDTKSIKTESSGSRDLDLEVMAAIRDTHGGEA